MKTYIRKLFLAVFVLHSAIGFSFFSELESEPGGENIFIRRHLREESDQSKLITLYIYKKNYTGVAHLEEEIPKGYIIEGLESANGFFELSGNTLNVVWYQMPANSTLKVMYRLMIPEQTRNSDPLLIKGVFTCSIRNREMKLYINSTFLKEGNPFTELEGGEDVFSSGKEEGDKAKESEAKIEVKTSEPVTTAEELLELKESDPKLKSSNNHKWVNKDELADPRAANSKVLYGNRGYIIYKIHIDAMEERVSEIEIRKKYYLPSNERVEVIKEDGVYQYSVGNHKRYTSAEEHRELMEFCGVEGASIVAYNNGEKISVEKARELE